MSYRKFFAVCIAFFFFSASLSSVFLLPRLHATEDKDVQREFESFDTESKALLEEARSYRNLKLYDPALERYRLLLERHPKNPYLLKEVGDTYTQDKNYSPANKFYSEAVFLKPHDPDLRLAKPRALENQGRRREALEELSKILEEDPAFKEGRIERANYLGWDKKWEEAIAEYDKLLEQYPEDPEILFRKAQALNWSGKWKEAIPIYEEIVKENPNDAEALKDLALLYSWTQQWEKSQQTFETLKKLNPQDPKILEELGNAYFYDQKYDSARKAYAQVIESNPDVARRLNARMSEVGILLAPTLTYSFLYYWERDRSGSGRRKTESTYHTVDYLHPLKRIFTFIASITARHDDIIKATSLTYGLGWQTKILRNLMHRIDLKWEPRNKNVNPRWSLRNTLTWKPRERYLVDVFHQFNTYWSGNKSNSVGFGISRLFFTKRDMLLGYRLTYDTAEEPSDYFVRAKTKEGERVSLFTNTFILEKYWTLLKRANLTTGISYDITTDGRNGLTLYANLGTRITNHLYASGGASWGIDNRDVQNGTASAYASYRF